MKDNIPVKVSMLWWSRMKAWTRLYVRSKSKPLKFPLVCSAHPVAEANVACDTSHTITLLNRWSVAYVCRVHHWIPNQTLSGAITVWAPNPFWSFALLGSTHSLSDPAAAQLVVSMSASLCCVLEMLLFQIHLLLPPLAEGQILPIRSASPDQSAGGFRQR